MIEHKKEGRKGERMNNMRKYELLLFDADETLLDFHKAMCEALSLSLARYGTACTDEMINTYDKINKDYWRRYEGGEISRAHMQMGRFEDFLATIGIDCPPREFDRAYLDNLSACPFLLEGAEPLCEELSEHYRMAIVTNGISSMQRKRVEASKIAKYFENVLISGDTEYKKPEKGFFDYVFSFYGDVPREKVLIIGDTLAADIKGGNNAGIDTCWLNRAGEPQNPSIHADYEVHSFADIRNLLI